MQILCHFSVSYPKSIHFSAMCVIDAATVRRSEAQLRPKWPWIKTVTSLTSSAPSTSSPSLVGGVTLETVMVQFQSMDACLDTLSDELCQVNTCVNRITRQQACLGGFMASPSLSLVASEDEDNDGDSDHNDDDGDKDASSSNDDMMIA